MTKKEVVAITEIERASSLLLMTETAPAVFHDMHNMLTWLDLELRNLRSRLELFSQKDLPDDEKERKSHYTQRSINTMQDSVNDLLRLVRLQTRGLVVFEGEETFDVNEALRSAEEFVSIFADRNRVQFKLEYVPVPLLVRGVFSRLSQALMNILVNAIQWSATGTVQSRNIYTSVSYESEDIAPIKIRITDNGPGIPKKLWQNVFDLGYTTRPNGTGIGLYLARSFVSSFGGTLSIDQSSATSGTTFLIELPEADE